jgi:hypothetical protein
VVVKSKGYKEHLPDLRETLECMRKYDLRMNPKNVPLGCQLDSFWVLWSIKEELRLVRKA